VYNVTLYFKEHKRNHAQKCLHSVAIFVENIDLTVSNRIPFYALKFVIWRPNVY